MFSFSENAFTCEGCKRMFTSLNFLARHKKYHCSSKTGVKSHWKCEKCGMAFITLRNFDNHACKVLIRLNELTTSNPLRTQDKSEKSHQCTQCNKAFSHACTLTAHLRNHTGEKPYQCTQCNKAFSHACTLTAHLRQSHR